MQWIDLWLPHLPIYSLQAPCPRLRFNDPPTDKQGILLFYRSFSNDYFVLVLDGLRHTVAVVASPYDSIACFHFSLCAAMQLCHLMEKSTQINYIVPASNKLYVQLFMVLGFNRLRGRARDTA